MLIDLNNRMNKWFDELREPYRMIVFVTTLLVLLVINKTVFTGSYAGLVIVLVASIYSRALYIFAKKMGKTS